MTSAITRPTFERWLGVVLVVMSVASIIFVAVQTQRLSDVTECQSVYNDAYTKAIQERSSAAREERQAQRTLLTTLLGGATTEKEGREAFDRYLSSLDEADRARDAAVLPTRRC